MATRRDVLAGAAAIPLMASIASADVAERPKYMGVRYQGWTPDTHPEFTFIQRFDSRDATEHTIVGVSVHNGPMQFVSDAEAERHIQAIWDAHLVEHENVRSQHAANAEKSIALHKSIWLPHDPDLIRAHHLRRAKDQLSLYRTHVQELMDQRGRQIGPSHPTLALEIYARVMQERAARIA